MRERVSEERSLVEVEIRVGEWEKRKLKVESQVNRGKHWCWRTALEGRPYTGYSKSEEDDPHAKAAWGAPGRAENHGPLKSKGATPGFTPKFGGTNGRQEKPSPLTDGVSYGSSICGWHKRQRYI
jgi:hypothetical protein